MKYKIITYLSGVLIFFLSFLILFLLLKELLVITDIPISLSRHFMPVYALITLLLPGLFGFLISRFFVKWYQKRKIIDVKWIPHSRPIIYFLIALYLLTAFAGIPSVQSYNSTWAMKEYKTIHAENNERNVDSHPYICTYFALPILPFIVMSYHEYQIAGLYGWGGWDIQIWYFVGVSRILSLTVWIS